MKVLIDTNVFINGLSHPESTCGRVLNTLESFSVVLPAIIIDELRRNLTQEQFSYFFKLISTLEVKIDYASPSERLVRTYMKLGLKKGDILIAAFAEQEGVDYIVSINRHFIKELNTDKFRLVTPEEFLELRGGC